MVRGCKEDGKLSHEEVWSEEGNVVGEAREVGK
jgi:hypothetical protein